MEVLSQNCVKGAWEQGVCECQPGYASYFDATSLGQQYCTSTLAEVGKRITNYEPGHYLHLVAIAVSVTLAAAACVALISAVAAIVNIVRIKKRIKAARRKLITFEAARLKRDGGEDISATQWTPPEKFQCINKQKNEKEKPRGRAKALAVYKPETDKELKLKPGQEITDVVVLQNGWCKGKSADGKTGFFPATFVEIYS